MASENENEKRDTVADILAEMFDFSDKRIEEGRDHAMTSECVGLVVHQLAKRFEAAWKRESAGNAAAIREALVALRDAARNFYHQILNSKYNDIMDEYKCRERGLPALLDLRYAIQKANFAISAPPRQCDVGTAEEQVRRHCGMCVAITKNGTKGCDYSKCNSCFAKWAQMPYEAQEGGAK